MLDAGFVSRRRDLVADVLAQDLLLFVTPEVLRGSRSCFLRTTFVAASRSSKKCTSARTAPARSRNNWRGRCVTTRIWCCSTPMRRSIRWVSAWIRPEGFGGGTVAYSALQPLVWLGFRTLYLHGLDLRGASVSPRFYESADARLPSALDRQFDSHIRPAFRDASRLLGARGLRIHNLSPGSALDESVFPKRHWTTLKRHALPS